MKRIFTILKAAGFDGFILAIIAAIILAWFFPQVGITEKPVSLEKLAGYGVSGIFFFYGLKLNFKKMMRGIANWKMHLLIQATTFVLFPLLILALKPFFPDPEAREMWIALFFLASLPSTVSSSVVMVSIAGGNIPGAIFNASISALIGLFVTPLWIGLFIPDASNADTSEVVTKLILQVLLPVLLGMALNPFGGKFAEKNRRLLKLFDQSVILMIIFTSFSRSFYFGLFGDFSAIEIILMGAGMLLLFFVVFFIVKRVAGLFRFSAEDEIAAVFCGSKKSLVHGTVMSKVLFAGNPLAGLYLLPLMMYHALQLIASGIIARRYATGKNRTV